MSRLAVLFWAGLLLISTSRAETSRESALAVPATSPASSEPPGPPDAAVSVGDPLEDVAESIVEGVHQRIETENGPVHVWHPLGYDPKSAVTIVYVHGYWIDVDEAWLQHGLPEQFGYANVNALFIACEAPTHPNEPVWWRSVASLLKSVGEEVALPRGRVVAIGHSGAYRTFTEWVRDPRLDTLVLLDAGYGPVTPFRTWARGSPRRRMISVGDDTISWTTMLHRWIPTRLRVDDIAQLADPALRPRFAKERHVHVRSTVGHYELVTGGEALPNLVRLLAPQLPISPD